MILTLAMTLALLLGGINAATASSEDTTPQDENNARSHIVDIG
ncbi:MAG TPA: hypothetical protein VD861_04965 [Pyrinomonadaceae bacterium]|nr:hypothetical protein [Pyrinomonadaceae bacterium]